MSISGEAPTHSSWIFAECYWDDVVKSVDANAFSRWAGFTLPPLVFWQAATSMLGGVRRRRQLRWRQNPFSWYSFLCNSFWNVTLRPVAAYFLMLLAAVDILPAPEKRLENDRSLGRLKSVLVIAADTYSFTAEETLARGIRRRFWNAFAALQRECDRVVVVAHSQGGAIAHATLIEKQTAPAALVGLGSGLGPLRTATRAARGRLPHARLLLTVFCGMMACAMAGVAFFDVLAVATLLLMLVLIAVLGGGLFITESLLDGTQSAAELLRTSTAEVRSQAFISRALERFLDYLSQSLVMTAFACLFVFGTVRLIFGHQTRDAPRGLSAVEIPGLTRDRWYEFYSPLDPVCTGTPANKFATAVRVQNPTAWRIWREHSGYLAKGSPVLPVLANLLATVGEVPLARCDSGRASRWWTRVRRLSVSILSIAAWLVVFFGTS